MQCRRGSNTGAIFQLWNNVMILILSSYVLLACINPIWSRLGDFAGPMGFVLVLWRSGL